MPSTGDMQLYLSGGNTNTDQNASLGGVISTDVAGVVVSQNFTQPVNITGVTIKDAFDNAYGEGTLRFYDAPREYTWQPLGGAESSAVNVVAAGNYTIGSLSLGSVFITHDGTYPTGDQTDGIEISTASNLSFDNIGYTESADGDIEYRCLYIKNTHNTDMVGAVSTWIELQPNGPDSLEFGLDPAGVGDGITSGVAVIIATESIAPAGVTFTIPTSGSPLVVGNIASGQAQALWMKRTIPANSTQFVPFDVSTIGLEIFI